MARIEARRKLDDLFMKGTEIRFGADENGVPWGKVGPFVDDKGAPVPAGPDDLCMFIRPPNPVQREEALRNAQAKRSLALYRALREKESEEHSTAMAFLADMSDDILIDYVLVSNNSERVDEAQREILAKDEWKEMTSYTDAARQFQDKTPEELANDPDWEAFQEIDEKFSREVVQRAHELEEADEESLRFLITSGNREKIEQQALKKRSQLSATQAFINEYELWMNYYAVREVDDPNMLWFAHAQDFATTDELVKETIAKALEPFIADGITAKNSQGVASGSDSSVPPVTPETSESSTPEEPSE